MQTMLTPGRIARMTDGEVNARVYAPDAAWGLTRLARDLGITPPRDASGRMGTALAIVKAMADAHEELDAPPVDPDRVVETTRPADGGEDAEMSGDEERNYDSNGNA